MGNDYSDPTFDREMARQNEINQREIKQRREKLFETALDFQKSQGQQSWTGEEL